MIAVGITGSIASGKSFLLKYLKNIGYCTFSTDKYVAKLYQLTSIKAKILNILPGLEVFDKKAIANLIYNDENARDILNSFIHPLVSKGIEIFKRKNSQKTFVFIEVPLLFEVGFEKYFDFIVTTFCEDKSRLTRAKINPSFDQEIYNKINLIQISQNEKIKRSDFVFNTDCNLVELTRQVAELKKVLMWELEK